jgi:hypothetical protein
MTYVQPAVIRPNRGLAVAVQVLIGVSVVAHAIATQADYRSEPVDITTVLFTSLDFGVLVLAAALFMTWLWQAWGNAEVIVAPRAMRWRRGWTIGSWFVPLADFVLPALVVANVCDASSGWRRSSRRFVTLWWLLFLFTQIVGRGYYDTAHWNVANGQIVDYVVQRHSLHSTLPMWILMTVLEVAAAVMAIVLVRRVADMQTAAPIAQASPPAPV